MQLASDSFYPERRRLLNPPLVLARVLLSRRDFELGVSRAPACRMGIIGH